MRFLLDANLSPRITADLRAAGREASHVREVSLRHATDEEIMAFADEHSFVVVSQDTDFTNLLFRRKATRPSVILLRDLSTLSASAVADLLIANIPAAEDALVDGVVVALHDERIRIHRLPIGIAHSGD